MIVYKWVHKKGKKYYSLLNYGFLSLSKKIITNQAPYEIGKYYINDEVETEKLRKRFLELNRKIPHYLKTGFYFWKNNCKINFRIKERMKQLGGDINAVLKCKIKKEDILSFERGNSVIRVKRFKILKEVI